MSDAQEQFEQLFAMREANCPEDFDSAEQQRIGGALCEGNGERLLTESPSPFAGRPPAKTASSGENSGTVRPAEPNEEA